MKFLVMSLMLFVSQGAFAYNFICSNPEQTIRVSGAVSEDSLQYMDAGKTYQIIYNGEAFDATLTQADVVENISHTPYVVFWIQFAKNATTVIDELVFCKELF